MATKKKDNINHPEHYTNGSIECLDAIEAALGSERFAGYLQGNIMKYVWRYPFKNGVEDLQKAQFYINQLIIEESR